jgi:hypothetical protein
MSTQSMHSAEHPMELVARYNKNRALFSGGWGVRKPVNILSNLVRTVCYVLGDHFVKAMNESALSKTERVVNGAVETSNATTLLRGSFPQRTWKRNSAFLVYREQMEANKEALLNHKMCEIAGKDFSK